MPSDASLPPRRRRHIGLWILGALVVAVIAVVALWDWDWFLPIVDSQASAAIGRKTTAQHLHVSLGRVTTVTLDDVEIANADGFDASKPFAHADKLAVQLDVMAYIHSRQIVIPQITLDHPVVEADERADKTANWPTGSSNGQPTGKTADPNAGPKIGQLVINDGSVHAILAPLKADFNLDVATKQGATKQGATEQGDAAGTTSDGQIVVGVKGTYAAQPITGQIIGGAVLSIRDTAHPYPINLHLANGPTKVALTGTVQNPLNFAGADLTLEFAGPDAELLTPLTGVPIPRTPPYSIAGKLDYADKKVRFTNFKGRLGESDINGDILVDPTGAKPMVDANLFSHTVQLADLGGFIGATPGRKGEANQSAQQKTELVKNEASRRILPDTPISLPKLTAANVKLRYKGEHILGRSVPLDNIVADIDITDGRIQVHPLAFGVGAGQITLDADLAPATGKDLKADIGIQFRRVDLARLLSATHLVEGAGSMSGSAKLVATGDSLASLLGHGDGDLKLGMSGGNLSALLVDIAGLEFGNALLSALGIPQRADLRCFAADYVLTHGVMHTKTLILDTSEARVQGTGDVDLANETIDYKLKTASTHFSIGTLPTPIDITGPLKSPSIRPEIGPLAARAGAAIGLGILFPPAALIPTIQFGTGDDGACQVAEAPAATSTAAATPVHKTRAPIRRPVRRR
jgi:uncharacterized protein involved in outer membrane biogenesis